MNPLIIVGTPIGNLGDLSSRALETLQSVDLVACEDSRRTGSLYHHLGIAHPRFVVLNEHTERDVTQRLIEALQSDKQVAIVTDAGMPLVSDPGWYLSQEVLKAGGELEVIPGPTAVTSSLVLSGLAADRFTFQGFLPRSGMERSQRLGEIATSHITSILYESPHRLAQTLRDLGEVAGTERSVAVCRELTKMHQEVWRCSLGEAVERAEEKKVKGEIVVVVDGAPPAAPATDDDIATYVSAQLAQGASTRDAVDAAVAQLGVAKRRAYGIAIDLA